MKLKILITGAHGDLACSIIKIIKKEFPMSIIIGTDLIKHGPGEELFDKIYKSPSVKNTKYKKFFKNIVKKIDLIIPTTETEINYLAKNKLTKKKILINKYQIIKTFNEKIKTHNFLIKEFKPMSLKYCYLLKNSSRIKNKKLPFFLKKNIGSGNQNYQIIDNKIKLQNLTQLNNKEWVIEEYLNKKSPEFTAAIVKFKKFNKICIFKRKLHKLGHTMYAEVYKNPKIERQLLKISQRINLNGCLNVQFKIINNRIKIFDINPRLSSSVRMRDMIGFHDCIWWIKNKLNINFATKIKIKNKLKIIKSFEEKIIS